MIARHRPYIDTSDILAALRPGAGRAEFEAEVAARAGARYAVAFAYGHSGLIACLRALGLTDIDVVLPAYTCTVVADSVVSAGNHPVFADIDLADYNMSLDAMGAALTPRTRVVIATHMYGYPTDVDAIREVVNSEQVLIIEDRALGLLASMPGTDGLRGDFGLFSFGLAKHLFTVQGGVIVTNSADYHRRLRAYRDREMDRVPAALWVKRWVRLLSDYIPYGKSALNALRASIQHAPASGSDPEDSNTASTLVADDYASGLAGFQARVGLSQLHKLDEILRRRRELAEFYDAQLRDVSGLTLAPIVPGANYSHYTIRVEQRDAIGFRDRMRERGVEVGQVYDHVLPYRNRFRPYARGSYPNTVQATREVVNLPIHPRIHTSEAHYIAECARDILRQMPQGSYQ